VNAKTLVFLTSALVWGCGQLHAPAALPPEERTPGTHWIGGWVNPKAGPDDMQKWKFSTLPWREVRPSVRPARSQLLYRQSHSDSCNSIESAGNEAAGTAYNESQYTNSCIPRIYSMGPKSDYHLHACSGFHGSECPDFGSLVCEMAWRFGGPEELHLQVRSWGWKQDAPMKH
jgi:hypothetical protein